MTEAPARARFPEPTPDANRWRTDWARLIENLQKTGLSQQYIADWVGIGKSTLQSYMVEDCRSEPQHWVGEQILLLWCQVTGYRREDAPRWRRPLSVSEILKAHQ
jgi:hypothetical protein